MDNRTEILRGILQLCQQEITDIGDITAKVILLFNDHTRQLLVIPEMSPEVRSQLPQKLQELVNEQAQSATGGLGAAIFCATGWRTAQLDERPSLASDKEEVLVVEFAETGQTTVVTIPIIRSENGASSFGPEDFAELPSPASRWLAPLFPAPVLH